MQSCFDIAICLLFLNLFHLCSLFESSNILTDRSSVEINNTIDYE